MKWPLSVVCMKWRAAIPSRTTYTAAHVNTLRSMVARHYPRQHRFICITDDAAGLHPDIEVIEGWNDHELLPPPQGGVNPSCYRRLKLFATDAGVLLGPRFVSMDLDAVILDDLQPLWDRDEEFVMYKSPMPLKSQIYNGSMFLMTAGTRARVWADFDPGSSPAKARAAGLVGSDQAWIQHCLGRDIPSWGEREGVHSWRGRCRQLGGKLPVGARCVFFQGRRKPFDQEVQKLAPWVKENYR